MQVVEIPSYDNAGVVVSWIEVQAGVPSLDIYLHALNEAFDSYREAIGFSPKNTNNETVLIKRSFFKKKKIFKFSY